MATAADRFGAVDPTAIPEIDEGYVRIDVWLPLSLLSFMDREADRRMMRRGPLIRDVLRVFREQREKHL